MSDPAADVSPAAGTPVTIRPLAAADSAAYRVLQLSLFPDKSPAEVDAEVGPYLATGLLHGTPGAILVAWERGSNSPPGAATPAAGVAGRPIGFVEVALHPVAHGCSTSPVGMVEGLFVVPDRRGRGVARRLLGAAADWAAGQGCRELASSCELGNEASRRAHVADGFAEVERSIHFRRPIAGAAAAAAAPTPPQPPGDGDWVALQPGPIDVPAAVRFVADPRAGGIDVFLGTTRAEQNAAGRALVALDYEAYPEMAVARMRRLVADARGRWPVVKVALLHRVGRVPVAEPSVVIAVACPHRGEAFDACRWLIDALKADVPVWKREVWADGSATWVHPT